VPILRRDVGAEDKPGAFDLTLHRAASTLRG